MSNAREEALKRYPPEEPFLNDDGRWDQVDDWGYSEMQRDAFVAGAEWAVRSSREARPMTAYDPAHYETQVRLTVAYTYTLEGAEIWLHRSNRTLGDRVPINLIREGRGAEVLAAAQRIED